MRHRHHVERNIELPLELKGWDKSKRRERAQEMLELVKLPEFAKHMPGGSTLAEIYHRLGEVSKNLAHEVHTNGWFGLAKQDMG